MSAKFSCNQCNAAVAPEDSHAVRRAIGFYGVYISPTMQEGGPQSPGGPHLCIPCICKVLTEGKRPPDGDEIPF